MNRILCLLCLFVGINPAISTNGEDNVVTLPFGEGLGDRIGPYAAEAVSEARNVAGKYIFYGREETRIFISENGVISFGEGFSDPFPSPLPLTNRSGTSSVPPLIAGFWGDIDVPKNGGAIFYVELRPNNRRFGRARAQVLNLLREGFGRSLEDFDPTHIFQSTWETVHQNDPGIAKRAVTFQIVLVTDSVQTYVLLLYSDVRWNRSNGHGVLVGFNAGDGMRSFTHPQYTNDTILDLDFETNARTIGAHVYRVDGSDVIEPTDEQKSEDICMLSLNEERQYECTCPTEEKPVLAFNKISCLRKPLALMFVNDTPAVSGNTITAIFSANRDNVEIFCHIPRINRRDKEDCSSGVFRRSGVPPGRYSIRVIAYDRITGERAILRSSVTIAKMAPDSPEENTFCGVTIVNRGTAARSSNAVIYFTGTGASRNFMCRIDQGKRAPCESPLSINGLSPGQHRVVVIPDGPECGRNNSNASSVRFTVRV